MSYDYVGTPLTAKGQKYESPKSLQEKLCLLPDGRLLVSKSQKTNFEVSAFEARLTRSGHPYEVEYVDFSVINAAYEGVDKQKNNTSEMQGFAKRLFKQATDRHASDIHIRIDRIQTTILFGIHNDLIHQESHPIEFGKQLLTAIYGAMTDVSDATYESLSRQDARISDKSKMPDGLDGIRIATSPQVGGQIMVLRLLYDDAKASHDVETLGFSPQHAKNLKYVSRKPTGINIITGPTGSGKSTTLQRQLSAVMKGYNYRKNLITVEDPPEYTIVGAVQTPVTDAASAEQRSMKFQEAILSAMRLAPDIIMIGEVRDQESALLAFRAAMTGHQVWTTLHTIGVFPTFARLIDLGIPADLLYDADIVTSITSQRLVKLLCPKCKQPLKEPSERYGQEDIDRIRRVASDSEVFVFGPGCPHCRNTGNIGRSVVAENMVASLELMKVLKAEGRSGGYDYWRKKMGGVSMLGHAIQKVRKGIIDPFEAETVVSQFDSAFTERGG